MRHGRAILVDEGQHPLGDRNLRAAGPWSTPIETRLAWPDAGHTKFWTAWGDSRVGKAAGWQDPLEPATWEKRDLSYGGRSHKESQAFSLPLATSLDETKDLGMSVVASPEDLILEMRLRTTKDGHLTFSRANHRISSSRPVRFALDLTPHAADWRSGVAWLVSRYPQYFDPPNPTVQAMSGCGAYSSHAEIGDVQRLKRMAFRVNWKARLCLKTGLPWFGKEREDTRTSTTPRRAETWHVCC